MYKIGTWQFFRYLSAYLLFSLVTFVATSGGWILMALLYLGIWYIILVLAASFIVLSYRNRDVKELILYPIWLIPIGINQVALLLLNFGTCGDYGGSYNFIQLFYSANQVCTDTSEPIFPFQLFYYLFIFYLILSVSFIVRTLFSNLSLKTTESVRTKTRNSLGSVFTIIIFLILFLLQFFLGLMNISF